MGRWDWIEGVRAETPSRVAVRELGKVLTSELGSWPPELEWCDEATRDRYAEVLAAEAPTPSAEALSESLRLVRWEMSRDFDAIGYYERNHSLEQTCPAPADQLACAFLRTYFTEAFLDLIERTENRVKRSDLLAGIDELELRLKRAWHARN